jgi:hypothetical protein
VEVPALYNRYRSNRASGLERDRQAAYSSACGGKEGVCNRRRDRRHAVFAKATGIDIARHNIGFDARHFVHSHHSEISAGSLHGASFPEINFAVQSGRETPCDSAFHLALKSGGIDNLSLAKILSTPKTAQFLVTSSPYAVDFKDGQSFGEAQGLPTPTTEMENELRNRPDLCIGTG